MPWQGMSCKQTLKVTSVSPGFELNGEEVGQKYILLYLASDSSMSLVKIIGVEGSYCQGD